MSSSYRRIESSHARKAQTVQNWSVASRQATCFRWPSAARPISRSFRCHLRRMTFGIGHGIHVYVYRDTHVIVGP